MSSIVWTRSYAGRMRRFQLAVGIAQVAISSLQLGHIAMPRHISSRRNGHGMALVRDHEDTAIGTVLGTESAADTMVLDHDLQMFASVNRINRASDHAMWVGAGSTRRGDQEVINSRSGAEQPGDKRSVRSRAVSFDARFGTGVAPRAVVQIQHQDVLSLIQSIRDVIIQYPVPNR